ncbi:MAG: hypothetical protein RBU29_02010, partial [bacterium]|jgi:hypothetical protein|nr:hypothetical protein [bacterium]
VGQVFTYKHSGPQPWSDGNTDASGKRVVAVMGKTADSKRWRIEERYDAIEGTLVGEYDDKSLLYRQTLRAAGGELHILFSTPIPVRYGKLEVGEQKISQYTQTFLDSAGTPVGSAQVTDTTTRGEYDIRIITPAGAYLCRNFTSVIEIQTILQGQTTVFSGTVKTYWCDSLGWMVKEEGSFNPILVEGEPTQPGYKTESVLESVE